MIFPFFFYVKTLIGQKKSLFWSRILARFFYNLSNIFVSGFDKDCLYFHVNTTITICSAIKSVIVTSLKLILSPSDLKNYDIISWLDRFLQFGYFRKNFLKLCKPTASRIILLTQSVEGRLFSPFLLCACTIRQKGAPQASCLRRG